MKRILVACFVALGVCFAAQAQEAPKANPTDEASCAAQNYKWEGDRCFTGKQCQLPDKVSGEEAYKGGSLGCSRVKLGTKKFLDELKDNDEVMAQVCKDANHRWILGYCFTGNRCPIKGKQGYEAVKGGILGCSEFGPPPRKYVSPKKQVNI